MAVSVVCFQLWTTVSLKHAAEQHLLKYGNGHTIDIRAAAVIPHLDISSRACCFSKIEELSKPCPYAGVTVQHVTMACSGFDTSCWQSFVSQL